MKFNSRQIIVLVGCLALFAIIYFGLDTKTPDQKAFEKSRVSTIEATGIQNIVMDAKKSLTKEQLNIVETLQSEFQNTQDDSLKVDKAKSLASKWYEIGFPIVSGYYAEEIANIENTQEAWSITGTTYSIGLKNATSEKELQFAKGRAVKAFENAISLADDNVSDKINLALIYVDYPDTSPMQGIQMLLKLNESNPDNVQVMNQLARLAIRSNQIDKAITRLEKALTLEPDNNNSICLIAQAYQLAGNDAKAVEFQNKCRK